MMAPDGCTLLLASTASAINASFHPLLAYDEINAALADPATQQRLAELGAVPVAGNTSQFGAMLVPKTERWGEMAEPLGQKKTVRRRIFSGWPAGTGRAILLILSSVRRLS